MISIITPVFNEGENIGIFLMELKSALKVLKDNFEIIVVDDGSKDGTFSALKNEAGRDNRIKVIRFARNFGQTAAISAGIETSSGEIIVTIDGDLENDPCDIPKMIELINNGNDLISGWRRNRWQGRFFSRKLPSLIANWLISKVSGIKLNDYGCMLKAYKREAIFDIDLYGEMHRFIPAFLHKEGAKIIEIPVNYRPRKYGKSKYGIGRTFRVLLDLFFIKFFTSYINKPMHFFGGVGLLSIFLGLISALASVYLKIFENLSFVRTPLPIFSALLIIIGVQLVVLGVLAEVIIRIYYKSENRTPYRIKEKINF